jgi:hypothetical protein
VTRRWLALAWAAVLAVSGVSCESPEAPSAPGARIVLRIDPAADGETLVYGAAAMFDSVVVNVFRAGSPLRLEVSRGVAITNDDPIDVAVECIAEKGKKVGVDLYVGGLLVYHGYDAGVDVIADVDNAVTIDAYPFFITDLTLTPAIIPNGAAFTLNWPHSPGAASYQVEESVTLDFATVASTTSAPDTVAYMPASPGSHYFRVRAATPYARGAASVPRFGYVTGGSNSVDVTGTTAAVIPGETISITGENLDFPGTTASIGAYPLVIESAAWGEITARVPRAATTAQVTVSSALGSDTSDYVIVQRVAYVTGGGEYYASYLDVLGPYAGDFGWSGVVAIPVTDLETRDMSVFDVVMVANDTGTWSASRAAAIAATRSNVLALGDGGLAFLRRAVNAISGVTAYTTTQKNLYTENPGAEVFQTPHSVTGGGLGGVWIDVSRNSRRTLAVEIKSGATAAGLYACTGQGFLGLGVNDRWALLDYPLPDVFSATKRYVYWGYATDPADMTSAGRDCLANVMNLLYKNSAPAD